ncbi:hypothetical protein [Chryseobacterium sp.]|uniref:hypothetical protein n=1 Tax=Chryseobacterium sp. TaxID=1871047 RepID=UPI0028A087E5|nr:hypothetical protein [Chryseobacterium sp.]
MTAKEELTKFFEGKNPADIAIKVNGFTGFKKTRIEELTEIEAEKLLRIYLPKAPTIEEENTALRDKLIQNAWISKVLKIAESTGIKDVGCFHKFNNWMLLNSKFKKHLNSHSTEELQELHQQLHAVKTNNARSAEKPLTEAWWKKGKENIKLN